MVNDMHSVEAVRSALDGYDTNVFYFDRWLARITAQACRQPGLSYVFTELFNYDDSEIYVEENDCNGKPLDFDGVRFEDAIGQFTQSTLIGVVRKDSVDGTDRMHIAPKPCFEIQKGDKFIVVADDDNMIKIDPGEVKRQKHDLDYKTTEYKDIARQEMHLLILSWNRGMPEVLINLDDFVSNDSTAKIVAMREYKDIELIRNKLKNINLDFVLADDLYDKRYL